MPTPSRTATTGRVELARKSLIAWWHSLTCDREAIVNLYSLQNNCSHGGAVEYLGSSCSRRHHLAMTMDESCRLFTREAQPMFKRNPPVRIIAKICHAPNGNTSHGNCREAWLWTSTDHTVVEFETGLCSSAKVLNAWEKGYELMIHSHDRMTYTWTVREPCVLSDYPCA